MHLNRKTRDECTLDELEILDAKILPTAERWVTGYPPGSVLFKHGCQTLEYWDHLSNPAVIRKIRDAEDMEHLRKCKDENCRRCARGVVS